MQNHHVAEYSIYSNNSERSRYRGVEPYVTLCSRPKAETLTSSACFCNRTTVLDVTAVQVCSHQHRQARITCYRMTW